MKIRQIHHYSKSIDSRYEPLEPVYSDHVMQYDNKLIASYDIDTKIPYGNTPFNRLVERLPVYPFKIKDKLTSNLLHGIEQEFNLTWLIDRSMIYFFDVPARPLSSKEKQLAT